MNVFSARVIFKAALDHQGNQQLRWGQCLMNAFHDFYPEEAKSINGTDLDPFHRNDECERFLGWMDRRVGRVESQRDR